MRKIRLILLLALFIVTLCSLTGCQTVKPLSSASAQPINVPVCASATRDPVILTACMDFGPDPLTMDQRYSRIKSCILFADTVYAEQLRMNRNVKLTQGQWDYLESYRTKDLTLCVRYGRDHFPSILHVKRDRQNLLNLSK